MMYSNHPIRTAICAVFLAAMAVGQDPTGEGSPDLVQAQREQEKAAARARADAERAAKAREADETGEKFAADGKTETGDTVFEAPVATDLAFFMAPVLSFQPRRIAPGATGDLEIVLSMQRGTVLAVGSRLELEYGAEQGPARLGEWALDDPAIGRDEGAFRGQPVYESYARIRVPVTVAADATHGKHPIVLKIVAEITDGRSGTVQRVAQTTARADLLVGPPLPSSGLSATRSTAVQPGREATSANVDDGSVPAGQAGRDDGGDARSVGSAKTESLSPRRAAERDPASSNADPLPVGEGDSDLLWVGLGAGALVLLVAVLALRRR